MGESDFEELVQILSSGQDIEVFSVFHVLSEDCDSVKLVFDLIRSQFLNELSENFLLFFGDNFSKFIFELGMVKSEELVQELRKGLLVNVEDQSINKFALILGTEDVGHDLLLSSSQKEGNQLREVSRKNGVERGLVNFDESEKSVEKLDRGIIMLILHFGLLDNFFGLFFSAFRRFFDSLDFFLVRVFLFVWACGLNRLFFFLLFLLLFLLLLLLLFFLFFLFFLRLFGFGSFSLFFGLLSFSFFFFLLFLGFCSFGFLLYLLLLFFGLFLSCWLSYCGLIFFRRIFFFFLRLFFLLYFLFFLSLLSLFG